MILLLGVPHITKRRCVEMAVAVLFTFDDSMTQSTYDRIMTEAFNDHIAPGVVSHTAGPLPDGWYAFDVYESEEVAERMKQGVVAGLSPMGVRVPEMTTYEVARALVRES
jgi:hypothetical protein